MTAHVTAVARDVNHRFSKQPRDHVNLIKGVGIDGDAHAGNTVQHRSRVAADPTKPNLRQAHLIHSELFDELAAQGFSVGPGDLGENIATRGIDLLALPRDTELALGSHAALRVTGLRNPCAQIDAFAQGLLAAVLIKGPNNTLIRKAGIMAIVIKGGQITTGDQIHTTLPVPPHFSLERV